MVFELKLVWVKEIPPMIGSMITINDLVIAWIALWKKRVCTLNDMVSQMAKVLSAPIVMSWGALPLTLDSSTATTPPSCAFNSISDVSLWIY